MPVASISLSDWPDVVSAMETMRLTGPASEGETEPPRHRRRGIIFTRSTGRCDELFESLAATWAAVAAMMQDEAGVGGEGAAEAEAEEEGEGVGGGVDGMQVVKYHSGMEEEAREAGFTTFTSNAPGLVVMVATTAAGVSLDHDRVRWTIHEGGVYGDSNMVQETGRAGRDGKPALAVLLVDNTTQSWMMKLERIARSSPQARLLHEEYPPIKTASIRRARQMLEYGIAGGDVDASVGVGGCGSGRGPLGTIIVRPPFIDGYAHAGVCLRAFGHASRDGFGASCLACPPGTLLCCACHRAVRSNELEASFPPTLVPPMLYEALKIAAPGAYAWCLVGWWWLRLWRLKKRRETLTERG